MGLIKQRVSIVGRRKKRVTALIDTGANTSFISAKLAQQIGVTKGRATTVEVGDGRIITGHITTAYIVLGRNRVPTGLIILKDTGGYNLIIGADFLQQRGVVLDYKTDKLRVRTGVKFYRYRKKYLR